VIHVATFDLHNNIPAVILNWAISQLAYYMMPLLVRHSR